MRYELTDLKLFLAIAQAQSLSVGASDMYLSAPSASYRLKNLEQAVGAALFLRGARGMELTPAGHVLLKHVRTVLASLEHMHGEMAAFANGAKGNIRLVANSSCITGLTPVLSRFLSAYPNVNVELSEQLSEDIVQSVADGAADVGLLAGNVDVLQLQAISYAADELILVTAPEHPLAAQGQVRFADILESDFVALSRKSSNSVFLMQMALKLGHRLNVRVNVQSFAVVLQLVRDNVGVSIVPRSVAAPLIEKALLAGVTLKEPWARRNQRAVAVDFTKLPAFVRQFVDDLVDGFSAHNQPSAESQ